MIESRRVPFFLLAALFTAVCVLPHAAHAQDDGTAANRELAAAAQARVKPVDPARVLRSPTEQETRDLIDDETKKQVLAEDFEELDTQASEFVRHKSVTGSGYPRIHLWHRGIGAALETLVTGRGRFSKFDAAHAHVDKWLTANPQSPTAHLAKAYLLQQEAWRIRGKGYADRVIEPDWKPYQEKIDEAGAYLDAHRWVAEHDPTWFVQRLNVALEQGLESEEFWNIFRDGVVRDRDYYPLYFSAVRSLYPRWGGSWAKIEEFARNATRMTSKEQGTSAYARIMWYALGDHPEEPVTRADWPTLRTGFEDLMKQRNNSWNKQNFAYFACEARDKEKARELMRRIGPLQRDGWRRGWYQPCYTWVVADEVAARQESERRMLVGQERREFHRTLTRLGLGALLALTLVIALLYRRRVRARAAAVAAGDPAEVSRKLRELDEEAARLRSLLKDPPQPR